MATMDVSLASSCRMIQCECRVDLGSDGAAATVIRAFLEAGITQTSTRCPSLEEVYQHMFGDRQLEIR
jgi:hypothetical protein